MLFLVRANGKSSLAGEWNRPRGDPRPGLTGAAALFRIALGSYPPRPPNVSAGSRSEEVHMPDVVLRRFATDALTLVEAWFDDPEIARRLGDRNWPARLLELIRTAPGTEFRGRRVAARGAWIAFDGTTPVGLADVEVYDPTPDGAGVPARLVDDQQAAPGPSAALSLVVNPARWGRGYGRAILRALHEAARVGGGAGLRGDGRAGQRRVDPLRRGSGVRGVSPTSPTTRGCWGSCSGFRRRCVRPATSRPAGSSRHPRSSSVRGSFVAAAPRCLGWAIRTRSSRRRRSTTGATWTMASPVPSACSSSGRTW